MTQRSSLHGQSATPQIAATALGLIEYAVAGDGPALLAIHGAMGGHDQSEMLATTIAPAGYRIIAVSRPGYLGTPLASNRTPEAQADLLAALLDTLRIEQAAVMAISGGGPSAIHFALRHPERCAALVLVSTIAGKMETRVPLSFKIMCLLWHWPAFADYSRKKVAADPARAAARSIHDPQILARTLNDPEIGPLYRAMQMIMFRNMGQRITGTQNDIAIAANAEFPLESVNVPTLVIHGTRDPLVPFDNHALQFVKRIPGAELVTVEGGEHVAIFTHRGQIKGAVAAFLAAKASSEPAQTH